MDVPFTIYGQKALRSIQAKFSLYRLFILIYIVYTTNKSEGWDTFINNFAIDLASATGAELTARHVEELQLRSVYTDGPVGGGAALQPLSRPHHHLAPCHGELRLVTRHRGRQARIPRGPQQVFLIIKTVPCTYVTLDALTVQ